MADLRDKYGNIIYRIEGNRINDIYGNWKYEIRDNRIYDTYGNWKYEVRGDYLYDTSGNMLGEMKNLVELLAPYGDSVSNPSGNSIGEFLKEKSKDEGVGGCLATLAGILVFVFKANWGGRIGLLLGVIVFIYGLVDGSPAGNGIIAIFFLGIIGAIIGAIVSFIIKIMKKFNLPVGVVVGVILGLCVAIAIFILLSNKSSKPVNVNEVSNKNSESIVANETFTDPRDNRTYKTTKIGDQTWMAENLKYEMEGSKCYDHEPDNCQKYGMLYNWEPALKACPSGWHLPKDYEWAALADYIGSGAGGKLKSTSGWDEDGNGTDEYGFSALPAGSGKSDGSFIMLGKYGYWWSVGDGTTDYYRYVSYEDSNLSRLKSTKKGSFPVRCVQD